MTVAGKLLNIAQAALDALSGLDETLGITYTLVAQAVNGISSAVGVAPTLGFNAGPAAVEALFAGAIDAAYLGPGPAVNAFLKSRGDFVVVAGATSGGTSLVVKPEITDAAQLRGKRIAGPHRGGHQDIARGTHAKDAGYRGEGHGGGERGKGRRGGRRTAGGWSRTGMWPGPRHGGIGPVTVRAICAQVGVPKPAGR